MGKVYQQLLPMDTDSTVKDQFGWLPVSVFKPQRREDWRQIIGDDGDETTRRSDDAKYLPGLRFSEFHPDLAEMVVKYWSLEGDLIVDPFAGRATRGFVAVNLERRYEGYEVAANTFAKTSERLASSPYGADSWRLHCFDGCVLGKSPNQSADLIFTCPPYHRIEKYQTAPDQLSDIPTYEDFLFRIKVCAKNCFRVLKAGKFLCWVCGDWRDGTFRTFHADSLRIFSEAGFAPHDVVIVHNNSPFAPLQAGKVAAKRYTSKVHEYLLVFRKPTSE
jgi:DNA modification methylase